MHITLMREPAELSKLFWSLTTPADIADMLEVTSINLNYWIYRTPEPKRYTTFFISKKTGMARKIDAPNANIKILQQKLNQVLQTVFQSKPSVHGFALGKSVRSNAGQHLNKRWVFNVDLEDFFPSINFGRVRGMFMGQPYNLPEKVATVLAHLCCFQGRLPQGAPTSPVVSNMICAQMDSQLQFLAQRHQCTYTRYADDITFSCTSRRFPVGIAVPNELNQIIPGSSLREIIGQNGFSINQRKVWLRGRDRRQVVTGVTVNAFPNLQRRYINQIRAMLHAWKRYGLGLAQKEWEEKYSNRHRAPWQTLPYFGKVLRGKIEYLRMIRGQEAGVHLKFFDQLYELDPNLAKGLGTPLNLLNRSYVALASGTLTPQQRGYQFEKLLNELFKLSRIHVSGSFRRNNGAEQIDGAFALGDWYYLVECKWESQLTAPSDIDVLKSKVGRSGNQTMGIFVSVQGWTSNVVDTMKQNQDKKVLLVNGEDIGAVLEGKIPLNKMIRGKLQALNIKSEPFCSVFDILSQQP